MTTKLRVNFEESVTDVCVMCVCVCDVCVCVMCVWCVCDVMCVCGV